MINLLLTFLLLAVSIICHGQTGTVTLTVDGIELGKGGELSAGLFEEKLFPKVGKQIIGRVIKVDAVVMNIVFTQVPPGYYGVAVFQDIDKNRELKTNFMGLPKEPIGFSNDARINFGPPSFEDAKFLVEMNRDIKLKIILR